MTPPRVGKFEAPALGWTSATPKVGAWPNTAHDRKMIRAETANTRFIVSLRISVDCASLAVRQLAAGLVRLLHFELVLPYRCGWRRRKPKALAAAVISVLNKRFDVIDDEHRYQHFPWLQFQ